MSSLGGYNLCAVAMALSDPDFSSVLLISKMNETQIAELRTDSRVRVFGYGTNKEDNDKNGSTEPQDTTSGEKNGENPPTPVESSEGDLYVNLDSPVGTHVLSFYDLNHGLITKQVVLELPFKTDGLRLEISEDCTLLSMSEANKTRLFSLSKPEDQIIAKELEYMTCHGDIGKEKRIQELMTWLNNAVHLRSANDFKSASVICQWDLNTLTDSSDLYPQHSFSIGPNLELLQSSHSFVLSPDGKTYTTVTCAPVLDFMSSVPESVDEPREKLPLKSGYLEPHVALPIAFPEPAKDDDSVNDNASNGVLDTTLNSINSIYNAIYSSSDEPMNSVSSGMSEGATSCEIGTGTSASVESPGESECDANDHQDNREDCLANGGTNEEAQDLIIPEDLDANFFKAMATSSLNNAFEIGQSVYIQGASTVSSATNWLWNIGLQANRTNGTANEDPDNQDDDEEFHDAREHHENEENETVSTSSADSPTATSSLMADQSEGSQASQSPDTGDEYQVDTSEDPIDPNTHAIQVEPVLGANGPVQEDAEDSFNTVIEPEDDEFASGSESELEALMSSSSDESIHGPDIGDVFQPRSEDSACDASRPKTPKKRTSTGSNQEPLNLNSNVDFERKT